MCQRMDHNTGRGMPQGVRATDSMTSGRDGVGSDPRLNGHGVKRDQTSSWRARALEY